MAIDHSHSNDDGDPVMKAHGQSVHGEERVHRNRGQTLVEFAFVLPVLLLLILGMTEYGRAYYMSSLVQNAAREGARYGVLHPRWIDSGDNPDPNNILARTTRFLPGLGLSQWTREYPTQIGGYQRIVRYRDSANRIKFEVAVVYVDYNAARGGRLRVTVTYLYDSIVPLLRSYYMRGNSTMRIE